jgi:hypothetical protein
VEKLALAADALTANRDCEAFIVFSKTDQFRPEEVERCKAAQGFPCSGVSASVGRTGAAPSAEETL